MAKPMKMPNGYGSVIKLGGKRRKPYAVRITVGREKDDDGHYRQKYKYLEYFEKYTEAVAYLADYNRELPVAEHKSLMEMPTFEDVFNEWINSKKNLKNPPAPRTIVVYENTFQRFKDLHKRKFVSLKLQDYQPIADALKNKSHTTMNTTRTVLSQMYDFAMKHEYVQSNISKIVTWEYTEPEQEMHRAFTDDEIRTLWKHSDDRVVQWILMMIYTGVRIKEFFEIETANVHLDEQYFTGGVKTKAGRGRTIPIHDKVLPFFKLNMNDSKYLIQGNKGSNFIGYSNFRDRYFIPCLNSLGMQHTIHDTRHTFATLAYRYELDEFKIKLIIGHAVQDLTKNVYTHIQPSELVVAVNKIKI